MSVSLIKQRGLPSIKIFRKDILIVAIKASESDF